MKLVSVFLALLLVPVVSFEQIPAPKHESRIHHLFAAHRDNDNLAQRFNDIRCALVLIQAGPRLGTGFFISGDGDLATASHVLGDRAFAPLPNGAINVTISIPSTISITDSKGVRTEIPARSVEFNPDAWVADVARIKTGVSTSCWLREADDRGSRPGEHLIAMGYPGLSFQALTIYTGIMSARLRTNLPTMINDKLAFTAPNEFIRVQMPISTGLSGAPIIDDENQALGIVTNAGGWTEDLDHLLLAFRGGAFATPLPAPAPGRSPNSVSFSLNSMAVTAELAALFHDFASPGYGDAVPLRYLRIPSKQNQPPSSQTR
ncbi:MAG: serine protease [Terracidiphilus sp.]|jgi:S1-C subfamily serine protease